MLIGFKAVPTLEYVSDYATPAPENDGLSFGLLKDALVGEVQDSRYPHRWFWWEYNGYIGWVSLVLALYGIVLSLKNRRLLPLIAFLFFITIFSFNQNSPINLWEMLHKLPLFSSLHVPSRVISYIVFILSIFAGVGMKELEDKDVKLAKLLLIVSIVSFFMINSNLIGETFNSNPPRVYKNTEGVFYQTEGAVNDMYRFMAEDVGVLRCYLPGSTLPVNVISRENQSYRGEAYLQSGGEIELVEFTPNYITVKATTSTDNVLIINQNYEEGWSANDKPALNTEGLISTHLAPGTQTITFSYRPREYVLGLLITLTGIALSIFMYIKWSREGTKG
jgi:hypothetical protein